MGAPWVYFWCCVIISGYGAGDFALRVGRFSNLWVCLCGFLLRLLGGLRVGFFGASTATATDTVVGVSGAALGVFISGTGASVVLLTAVATVGGIVGSVVGSLGRGFISPGVLAGRGGVMWCG